MSYSRTRDPERHLNLSKKSTTKKCFHFYFWTCCPNFFSKGTTILGRICKFHEQFEEWTFRKVGMNFSNSRVFRISSSNTFLEQLNVLMETLREEERWMCCCKRSRTARSSIKMGWYYMVSEASTERFAFRARASPLCGSECVKMQVSGHREKPETTILTVVFRVFDVCVFCALITVR